MISWLNKVLSYIKKKDSSQINESGSSLSNRIFCSKFNVEILSGLITNIPTTYKYNCPAGYKLGAKSLFENQGIFVTEVLQDGDENSEGEITLVVVNEGSEHYFFSKDSMVASVFFETISDPSTKAISFKDFINSDQPDRIAAENNSEIKGD